MMAKVSRYHPLLVALHWILAFLIIGALYFGAVKLAHMSNDAPEKLHGLQVHMTAGLVILALMLARLAVRGATARPPRAETGSAFLDRLAKISHATFYPAVLGMGLMGLLMALQAGLFGIVFGGHGALPPSLWVYWPRWGHYLISRFLMILIGLHVCGALYHVLVLRDGLLRRMFFGKRKAKWTGNGAA
jgi:cytochrome b561